MRELVDDSCAEPFHYTNLGFVLKHSGRTDEALPVFEAGLQRFPDSPELHWHRALLLLQIGRFREGLDDYEWRWRVADFPSKPRNFPQPLWDGSSQPKATLLVYAEQGFGDTLQFVRYLPFAARRVGQVVFEVQPELLQLVAYQQASGLNVVPPETRLVATGRPLPAFDMQVPLLSLPRQLSLYDFARPPCAGGYLAAPCGLRRALPFAFGQANTSGWPGLDRASHLSAQCVEKFRFCRLHSTVGFARY
jgi:tetratricopeptide (TPR) repeat protein